ncbi:MAG: hypothetical protein WKF37_25195 [Bryobacteraceae bacterium]
MHVRPPAEASQSLVPVIVLRPKLLIFGLVLLGFILAGLLYQRLGVAADQRRYPAQVS